MLDERQLRSCVTLSSLGSRPKGTGQSLVARYNRLPRTSNNHILGISAYSVGEESYLSGLDENQRGVVHRNLKSPSR
jgi:hypothetical protein